MSNRLNLDIRKLFEESGVQKTISSGVVIQYQDDPVDVVYFVLGGRARACNFERNGKEAWVNSFKSGDLIGLENILSGGPSQCQIIVDEDLIVVQFKRQSFLALMQDNPALNQMILQMLITQVKSFQTSRVETHNLSKRGRVASEIKRMATQECAKTKTYIIKPMPVISDMALRLGIARETVSRTVSDLVKNRVLERDATGFIVPDLSRLEAHMR